MTWLALAAVATAWLLQASNAQALLGVPAPAWLALALLAWCTCGARATCVVLVAGWTLCRADWLIDTRLPPSLAGQDVLVQGVVCDFPRVDPEALRLVLEPDGGVPFASGPKRIHLSWYDDPPAMVPGERWQLLVRLKPPHGLRNPGGFDFEQWLYVRGIAATGYVRLSQLNRRLDPGVIDCPVGTVRGLLAARITAELGEHPAAAYVAGVAVGATQGLTEADWDLMRSTGTTHLLAISGLNIAMVAAPFLLAWPLLGRVWSRLAGRPYAGAVPAVLAAAAYTALAGFAVSTVRALVMLVVATLLVGRRRRIGAGEVLGTAALVVLLIDPAAVITASFWLSFVAVAWLVLAAISLREGLGDEPRGGVSLRRLGGAILKLGWTQVALGLGLAPLGLAWFDQLSLVAPLANLVAVPVFTLLVMPLTLLGTALLVLVPSVGALLIVGAADVVHGLLWLLRFLVSSGFATWQPPPASTAALVLALVAALGLCWWRPLPLRALFVALLLPVVAGTARTGPELRVTVMDVGQGLAALVQTRRHALLYDTGPAFRLRDAGESVVVPVLRSAGVRHLDALVISHHDQDHAGGATTVLREYPHAPLIAPGPGRLVAGEFRSCRRGLAWEWDGVHFEMLNPDAGAAGLSDNDSSCVLRVRAGRSSVVLPGDIGRRREEYLARRDLLQRADLVLAPHHGSRSSSGEVLVGATRPRYVVFSAGYLNRWGFPAREVRERWASAGACTLETAVNGALVFENDDHGVLRLRRRERADSARLWTIAVPAPPCAGGKGLG